MNKPEVWAVPLSNVRRGIVALLLASLLVAVSWIIVAPAAQAETMEGTALKSGLKIEYPVPNGPLNLALQAPGHTWFTSPADDAVGLIVLRSAPDAPIMTYTIEYLVFATGSQPSDIAYAGDTVWFTQRGANKIGRITLTGGTLQIATIREYPIPTRNSQPAGIAVAPDGMVWFVEENAKKLGRFDPAAETFSEYSFADMLPTGNIMDTSDALADVTVQSSAKIWLTMPDYHTVVTYDVDRGRFSRAVTYNSETGVGKWPASIAVDSAGNVWVAAYGSGHIGRLTVGTLTNWTWHPTPTADSGPKGLAVQQDGANVQIWFTEQRADKLARFTFKPDGKLLATLELAQPTGSRPAGIAIGSDDHIWFAENGRRIVAELRPPYFHALHLPSVHIGN